MLQDFLDQSGGSDVYKFLENYLRPVFILNFIDLFTFCIDTPVNEKKKLLEHIKKTKRA